MNRNAVLKLLWLPLFALGSFASSTFVGAQQTSGADPAGLVPAAGAMRSGLNPVDSSGPDLNSMRGFASRTGSKASIPGGAVNSRSAWMAGVNNMSPKGVVIWNAPQANFNGASASSWSAGARNFGLNPQQGGLWLESPGAEAQSNTPVTSVGSNDSFIPLALTPKGTALIKGAGLSASYASHSGNGLGIRGVANPFAAQRGVGSVKSQFGSRTGGFGRLGNGSESKPATLVTPSTGTLNGPANDDTLRLNEGLGSESTLDSDELDSTDGTSH